MGKQSTRENKTIYQLCREAAGLTRAEASEKMDAVSDSKIEKFEYETQEPTPYDILQMADFAFVRAIIIAKIWSFIGICHLEDIIRRRFLCFIFKFFNF